MPDLAAGAAYDLVELTRPEAVRLLGLGCVGRVVYTDAALPAITPVNYALRGRAVVFRTAAGSRLARAVDGAVVAFEVDDVRHEPGPWWSVVVLGVAEVLDDAGNSGGADEVAVRPWAPGDHDQLVRVVPATVTGRRLCARRGAG